MVQFRATLAGVNSAAKWLTLSHEGDAKLVLEVPASEADAVLGLRLLHDKVLMISIEAEPSGYASS